MYYGHAPRRGRRRPAYEWVPSFFPSRRRKRRPLPTGFGPAPRRSRANPRGLRPREPMPSPYDPIPDSMHYPKLSLVPGSIGEGLVEMFAGAALTAVWLFWQYFLAAGLAVLALRYLTRHLKKQEKHFTCECEHAYSACRVSRKMSVNPPPTAAALEAAWAATRGGRRGDPAVLAARLRLGAMLSDLEPVVDQSYIRDETGAIVGRKPGLRGWINFYAPSLAPHYKALMAYKALADKLRLALQVEEPDILDNVLELGLKQEEERIKNSKNIEKITDDSHGVREVAHEATEVSGKIPEPTNELQQEDCKEVDQSPKKAMEATKNSKNVASEGAVKENGSMLNSMQLKIQINVLKSNIVNIKQAYHELFGSGMPGTMAAMEAVVRERLGLAWMRRGRKAEPAA